MTTQTVKDIQLARITRARLVKAGEMKAPDASGSARNEKLLEELESFEATARKKGKKLAFI